MTLPICQKCRNEMAVVAGEPPFCLACCGDDAPATVTPITPTHTCASCHLEIEWSARFTTEAHGEECMQPEIRMRRLECAVFELTQRVNRMLEGMGGR